MPAVSQAQRAYLNAHFGHAWVKVHHFDNKGKLPAHVGKKGKAVSHKKHNHTGKLHRGHHHMKHHHKDTAAHSSHGKMNRAHGTPHGFAPKEGAHEMGEATESHMGKNCSYA